MKLLEEFQELIKVLEADGIAYATCGGIAMAIHGFIRATKDIKIIIHESDLEKAFTAANHEVSK